MADVLIVDDDLDLATAEREALKLYGHRVRVAENGEAGLSAISERFPDVILLDIEMPVLDGPGMAYRMLIEDCGREHIPIVLTSGHAGLRDTARRIGTPYVIGKPTGMDPLVEMTERAVREGIAPVPTAPSVPRR